MLKWATNPRVQLLMLVALGLFVIVGTLLAFGVVRP